MEGGQRFTSSQAKASSSKSGALSTSAPPVSAAALAPASALTLHLQPICTHLGVNMKEEFVKRRLPSCVNRRGPLAAQVYIYGLPTSRHYGCWQEWRLQAAPDED